MKKEIMEHFSSLFIFGLTRLKQFSYFSPILEFLEALLANFSSDLISTADDDNPFGNEIELFSSFVDDFAVALQCAQ